MTGKQLIAQIQALPDEEQELEVVLWMSQFNTYCVLNHVWLEKGLKHTNLQHNRYSQTDTLNLSANV